MKIKIGTRGSKLALWQAHYTKRLLEELDVEVELVIIKTRGDQIQDIGFAKMEGKGFFTKEIEDALLRGDVDLAVHSMKDMPTNSPEGLSITAVSYREDPADWLIIRKDCVADKVLKLKENAVVGTSSARRKAQMLDFRPDVELIDIRGNVPTRLQKLRDGGFDAILLAAAGVSRLEIDMSDFELVKLHPKEMVPAPAQGVLAWQTCTDDKNVRRLMKKLHNADTAAVTNIERKVLQLMDGGCHMPLGVYCEIDSMNNYHVWAAKAVTWNSPVVRTRLSSNTNLQLAEKIVAELNEKIKISNWKFSSCRKLYF